jgi:hypothetical protein
MVQLDDPLGADAVQTTGVVGEHSYLATIISAGATLRIAAGAALITGNQRVAKSGDTDFVTAPFVGVNFISIDTGGQVFLLQAAASNALDLWTVNWNGSIFSALIRQNPAVGGVAPILFDGDGWRQLRERIVVTGSFTAKEFDSPHNRVNAIERVLGGVTTDVEGDAIGGLQLDATWITTGVLAHERGGLEFDASAVVDGDFIVGTSAGVMGLESGATARTSLGLGTGDTPQFTRLGLGGAADGTEELALTRTSTVLLGAGATASLGTTTAHDLELRRNSSLRIDLTGTGMTLADGSASTVIEIGAADTLGFYGATAVAKQSVGGTQPVTTFGEVEIVFDNLFGALAALGLITDTRA